MTTNKRDLASGLMFAGAGLCAMIIGRAYDMGSAARMGPGYFPTVLGALLTLLGVAIVVSALRSAEDEGIQLAWRPLVVLSGSVILFALLITRAGLAVTTVAVVIASRLACAENAWMETFILAVMLSAFCSALFSYALGLQLPVWPWFL